MNIFEILGVTSDTPKAEIEAKYLELKAELSEKRFSIGEEGNIAAKKLTELERAWRDYNAFNDGDHAKVDVGADFNYVESLLEKNDLAGAQEALDSIKERNAEWHYYQARIYYNREWLTESRKHLKIAVDMEPNNQKYKNALNKLEYKMGADNVPPQDFGNMNTQQMQENSFGNMLSNCCAAYCCMECCYSLFCCR